MAGSKRKREEAAADETHTTKTRAKPAAIARVDPTYGQRSAIPLDEDNNDDDANLSCEEEMDALAYLRSVRREAEGIPNLLVAPKVNSSDPDRDIYKNGVGDFRGRYVDGAFYAGPDEQDKEEEQDVQAEYFDSILVRFEALRQRLDQTPPLEVLQKLDEETPIYLGHLNSAKVKWWRWKLRTTDPLPAQLAAMDKDTVLGLLRLLGSGNLLQRGAEVNLSISRWMWSLLAKLPDRGALNSEEIGVVRELGKRAVLVGVGIREGNKWDEGMQEVEATYDVEDDEETWAEEGDDSERVGEATIAEEDCDDLADETPVREIMSSNNAAVNHQVTSSEAADAPAVVHAEMDELALAKARMLGLLQPAGEEAVTNLEIIEIVQEIVLDEKVDARAASPETTKKPTHNFQYNSTATVDMILTIAGEVYGQRDLLEFRGGWSV